MNKLLLMNTSLPTKIRKFNAFANDSFGNWSLGGGGISPGSATSTALNAQAVLAGASYVYGSSYAQRSIANLNKAREISFSLKGGTSQWGVVYQNSCNWYFKVCALVVIGSDGIKVNNVLLRSGSQNAEYNVRIMQSCIYINNTRYDYKNNWKLASSTSVTIRADASAGFVGTNAGSVNVWLNAPGVITVKW